MPIKDTRDIKIYCQDTGQEIKGIADIEINAEPTGIENPSERLSMTMSCEFEKQITRW